MQFQSPLITPEKLLGTRKLPYTVDIAFICFCPFPEQFNDYILPFQNDQRFFIHIHPQHVKFCYHKDINFIVISEVYGGPVNVSVVEELAYYGISTIIGFGFVGSLIEKFRIGDQIQASIALSELGTTPYYDISPYVYPTKSLFIESIPLAKIWTTNAIYREYSHEVEKIRELGYETVNMDTSHLFAACQKLNIQCMYLAIVTDQLNKNEDWQNELMNSVDIITHGAKISSIITIKQNELINDKLLNYLPEIIKITINKYELILHNIKNDVEKLCQENKVCLSHDHNHANNVLNHVITALKFEYIPIRVKYLVMMAAILHDCDDMKFFKTIDYSNAREILYKNGIIDDVDEIIRMISYVSYAINKDTIPVQATMNKYLLFPRFADRIEALGIEGVKRAFQFTLTSGAALYLPTTLKPDNLNQIFDIATLERVKHYNGKSLSMIDHYYDKLIRLSDFQTDNPYFMKMKNNIMQPLFDIIEMFMKDTLTNESIQQYINEQTNHII